MSQQEAVGEGRDDATYPSNRRLLMQKLRTPVAHQISGTKLERKHSYPQSTAQDTEQMNVESDSVVKVQSGLTLESREHDDRIRALRGNQDRWRVSRGVSDDQKQKYLSLFQTISPTQEGRLGANG